VVAVNWLQEPAGKTGGKLIDGKQFHTVLALEGGLCTGVAP